MSRIERWEDLRFALRDYWREMLCHPPFDVTAEMLEETWRIVAYLIPFEPPRPTVIIDELARLAQFETRDSFLRALEERYRYPHRSCSFEKQTVWREPLYRSDIVDCLVLRANDALADKDVAVATLQEWMRFEDLDYYRIWILASGRVFYYEALEQRGVYWAKDRGDKPSDLGPIHPRPANWDGVLSQIQKLATQVDAGLLLPRAKAGSVPLHENIA